MTLPFAEDDSAAKGMATAFSGSEQLWSSDSEASFDDDLIPTDEESIEVDEALLEELYRVGPRELVRKYQQHDPYEFLWKFGLRLPLVDMECPVSVLWGYVEEVLMRYVYCRQQLVEYAESPDPIATAKHLIQSSQRIVVLTGAGISVAAGIPDFRSPTNGLYAQIRQTYPHLPKPEYLFDLQCFQEDPEPFFLVLDKLRQKHARPTRVHRFLADLDCQGRLLMNFSQNIDGLEQASGINNITLCHGSVATSHCLSCSRAYKGDDAPRYCGSCQGLVKPDIVFFGEALPKLFFDNLELLKTADLLIVIGSSLKVQPVASIPDMLAPAVPQILINLTPIDDHNFDLVLLGDCQQLIEELGM